jgi:hypothetical protein
MNDVLLTLYLATITKSTLLTNTVRAHQFPIFIHCPLNSIV